MKILSLCVEEAIYRKNAILISAARGMCLSNESEITRYLDDFGGEIKSLGMKDEAGLFYPGFFSLPLSARPNLSKRSQNTLGEVDSTSSLILNQEHLIDLEFVARGEYDEAGDFHPYPNPGSDYVHSDLRKDFPSLLAVNAAQLRRKMLAADDLSDQYPHTDCIPSSKYTFCLKEGFELDIAKIFTSGLWYADDLHEFMFPGVFDSTNHFISAYCISKHGYLIPGCTSERDKFLPFSRYGPGAHKVIKVHAYSKNLTQDKIKVLEKLKEMPKFPLSHEVLHNPHWFCFKNKSIVSEPASITAPFGHIIVTNENLNVYIGGEKGPDSELYLYGEYGEEKEFFPGCSALASEQEFCLLPAFDFNHDPYDTFGRRFGIYFQKPTYRITQPLNHQDISSDDTRSSPDMFRVKGILEKKLMTPNSSMDDAAWFVWKQAALQEKEELARGRKVANNSRKRGRSESRSVDKEIVSESSSLFDKLESGSNSPGLKGMHWFSKTQKKVYEQLRVSEDESLAENKLEKKSSSSIPSPKRTPQMFHRTRNAVELDHFEGEKKLLEAAGSRATVEYVEKKTTAYSLAPVNRFKAKQSAMPPPLQNVEASDSAASSTEGGIGVVGGIGLVTERQRKEKDQTKYSLRRHVDTNKTDNLSRTPRATASKNVLTRLAQNKKIGSSAPQVNKTKSTPDQQQQTYRSNRDINRQQGQKISTFPKSRQQNNVVQGGPKEKGEEASSISLPASVTETKVGTDKIKERLQALGNLKGRLDGADPQSGDDKKNDVFKDGDSAKKVIPRHLLRKERKSTFESDFLPKLDDFSALNFTQSFRFSYFSMPEHVKSFNKQVTHGALRLPEIPVQKSKPPKSSLKKSERRKKLERIDLDDSVIFI